jgi:hypothetical protein
MCQQVNAEVSARCTARKPWREDDDRHWIPRGIKAAQDVENKKALLTERALLVAHVRPEQG